MADFLPTKEQSDIINSDDKYICILACAGSGKTFALTRRIARLINAFDVDPSSIIAITFTVMAANNLKHELAKIINERQAVSKMFIGTIHSFCFHLLRDAFSTDLETIKVLTDNQQYILLSRYFKEWDIKNVNQSMTKTKLIQGLLASFDIIKMESVNLDLLRQIHPEIFRVYNLYNKFLNDNYFYDYPELISKVHQAIVSSEKALLNILNSYQYLFVDEYQDVDSTQATIIEHIGNKAKLCVVGDDDQSIYQFRGTDVTNILNFSTSSKAKTFILSENRRCPKNILTIAENCIQKVLSRHPKQMSPIDHKGKVVITRFEALRDEISFIKGEIIELVNNNKVDSWGNIAILMRSVSSYGQYYLDALKTANIPYIAKGGRSLFNTAEVSIIVMFLEWLIKEPNTVQNLIIIKNIFNGKLNEELIHLNNTEIGMLSKNKAILFGLTENDFTNLTKLIKIRERYQMRKFNSILEIIFDFISYMKLLAKDTPESKAYNIAQFTQIVREYEEISQNKKIEYLCGYLVSYAQNAFDEASPIEEAINAVNVLTIHQAKGLEYDYVFIPMLVEHRFPVHTRQNRWLIDDNLFKANRYYNTEENERRLFYVACTRAKKGLYLLSSKDVGLINLKKPSKYYQEASHVLLPDKNEIPLSKSKKTIAKRYLVSSYSSLEYYLTCPYRYRLVVKYGLAFPLNPFLEFGQLIHIVMGFMNHSFSKGKMLSFPEIKEYYDKIFDKYFYNANVPHYVINKQKVRGLRAIQNYYNQKQDWFINVVDVEKDFEYISEKYLIRGRYDLLLKLNNNKYIIVDYKTGQPHEYLRTDFQMQLYSIAALEQLQIPVDSAILYYLESGHEKLYKINEAFLNEGRKNLNNVVDGILSENYDATPGKMCVRCEVKEFCSEHS